MIGWINYNGGMDGCVVIWVERWTDDEYMEVKWVD